MGIFGALAFAGIFYGIAEYENMTAWKWALASLAVTFTVEGLFSFSFIFILPAQFGLFCVLAWARVQAKKKFEVERVTRQEEDRRMRQEKAKLAREKAEQAKPDPAAAAREAKEAEEVRMRQERVRRVREAREQAERDAARQKESEGQ